MRLPPAVARIIPTLGLLDLVANDQAEDDEEQEDEEQEDSDMEIVED